MPATKIAIKAISTVLRGKRAVRTVSTGAPTTTLSSTSSDTSGTTSSTSTSTSSSTTVDSFDSDAAAASYAGPDEQDQTAALAVHGSPGAPAADVLGTDRPAVDALPGAATRLHPALALSEAEVRHAIRHEQARSVRPDGNSVEIEHELVAMNRNAVEYDFLTQIVSNNIKQLKMAITGRSV